MKQTNQPNPESQLNRRGFLKTASTAVVGSSLLGGLSIERSAFAAGDDLIKIALIGCGGRGSGAAIQALKAAGNAKLIAMADVDKSHLTWKLGSITEQATKDGHPQGVDVPEERQFVGWDAYHKPLNWRMSSSSPRRPASGPSIWKQRSTRANIFSRKNRSPWTAPASVVCSPPPRSPSRRI